MAKPLTALAYLRAALADGTFSWDTYASLKTGLGADVSAYGPPLGVTGAGAGLLASSPVSPGYSVSPRLTLAVSTTGLARSAQSAASGDLVAGAATVGDRAVAAHSDAMAVLSAFDDPFAVVYPQVAERAGVAATASLRVTVATTEASLAAQVAQLMNQVQSQGLSYPPTVVRASLDTPGVRSQVDALQRRVIYTDRMRLGVANTYEEAVGAFAALEADEEGTARRRYDEMIQAHGALAQTLARQAANEVSVYVKAREALSRVPREWRARGLGPYIDALTARAGFLLTVIRRIMLFYFWRGLRRADGTFALLEGEQASRGNPVNFSVIE